MAAAPPARADDRSDIERVLKQHYQGQVLNLRSCYRGSSLKFDLQGNVLGSAFVGGCAANQSLQVDDVRLGKSSVKLNGRRLVSFFGLDGARKAIATHDSLDVEVELGSAALDPEAIQQALGKVFRTSKDPPLQPPPTPDQYQSSRFEIQPGKPVRVRLKGTSEWKELKEVDEPIEVGQLEDSQAFYISSKAVKAPKGLETPNPGLSSAAEHQRHVDRSAELRVIVDSQGFVHSIHVTQAAGLGLDENSVVAVADWTFKPATLQGKPVAVVVTIELHFSAY